MFFLPPSIYDDSLLPPWLPHGTRVGIYLTEKSPLEHSFHLPFSLPVTSRFFPKLEEQS